MKRRLSILMAVMLVFCPVVALGSSVHTAVVDTVAPYDQAAIAAGSSIDIAVEFIIKGQQDGYATFDYVSEWALENGSFVPRQTSSITAEPKDAQSDEIYNAILKVYVDPAMTDGTYSLNIGAFNIENSNATGAKLGGGSPAYYNISVTGQAPPSPPPAADITAPLVQFAALEPAPNPDGWNKGPVVVGFTASDDLSGVKAVEPADKLVFDQEGAGQVKQVTAVDNAGNAAVYNSPEVNIDMTAPALEASLSAAPNGNGWFKDNVTVSFNASDALSGIADADAPKLADSEGYNIPVTGRAVDRAGNESTVTEYLNIDKTAPAIQVQGITNGAVIKLNQALPVTWQAADALSGVESASGSVVSGANIDTSTVGTKQLSFTAADKAGNVTSLSLSYKVIYNFSGILPPINADGSSIFKQGSTIPVKFALTDANGKAVPTAVARLYYSKVSGAASGNILEAISTSAATAGNLFRYDTTSSQYIFNLNTKALTVGTYQLTINLDDGNNYDVRISLK